MKTFLTAAHLVAGLWLLPAGAVEPVTTRTPPLPEAQTPSDSLKSALEKAKAAADKQKQLAAAPQMDAETRGKPAAQKRIEWQGVGMLRSGFKEEQVMRLLTQGGTVVEWGDKFHPDRRVPAGLSGVVGIAPGPGYTTAVKQDGTVVTWGYSGDHSKAPAGLSNVVSVVSTTSTMALKGDGTVVKWRLDGNYTTDLPAGLSNVVAVAGSSYSVALKGDGTVVDWGFRGFDHTEVPAGLSNVVAVAVGRSHAVALKGDGTVVAWGSNQDFVSKAVVGQSTVPTGLNGVVAIAAGDYHTVALLRLV